MPSILATLKHFQLTNKPCFHFSFRHLLLPPGHFVLRRCRPATSQFSSLYFDFVIFFLLLFEFIFILFDYISDAQHIHLIFFLNINIIRLTIIHITFLSYHQIFSLSCIYKFIMDLYLFAMILPRLSINTMLIILIQFVNIIINL